MGTASIYILTIEPGWLLARQGQRLKITVANLKENDSPRVRVQGQICSSQVVQLHENVCYIMCTTPELNPNSTYAAVEIAVGSSVDSKIVTLVRPSMQLISAGSNTGQIVFLPETLNQLGLSHLYNPPFAISPSRDYGELSSKVTFASSFDSIIVFEVLSPGQIFDSSNDFDLVLKPNYLSKCPNDYVESCALFLSQSIALTNVTVIVSTYDFLRARGTILISRCPPVFCGPGGRGLLLDGNFSIKQNKYVEKPAMLSIVPSYSQIALSVRPAIVPTGRPFTIMVKIQRFSAREVHNLFQCDFADTEGKVSQGIVGDVMQDESGDQLEILLRVPGLPVGPISGRIYSQEPTMSRSQTINTFNILSYQDPTGPSFVDWISSTQGPYTGALVQARLIGFPMMDSTTDVRSEIEMLCPHFFC